MKYRHAFDLYFTIEMNNLSQERPGQKSKTLQFKKINVHIEQQHGLGKCRATKGQNTDSPSLHFRS